MSRIEKGTQTKKDIQKVRDEVVKEIRGEKKKKGKASCTIIFLVVFFSFSGFFLYMIAATGLIRVPMFSSFAYDVPEPTREVQTGASLETVIEQTAKSTLTSRLHAGEGSLSDASLSIDLQESSFTTSLRSVLEESGLPMFESSQSQVVIKEEGTAELFLPIANNKHKTAVLLDIGMVSQDGHVNVKIEGMRLGSLGIPKSLVNFVVAQLIDQQINELNSALGQYARIDQIDFQQGFITLTGSLEVEIVEPL